MGITEKSIALEQAPKTLQKAVNDYMGEYLGVRLLGVFKKESTPFLDKSRVSTCYKVYLERANILIVMDATDFLDYKVYQDRMIAGDIQFFIDNTRWFQNR